MKLKTKTILILCKPELPCELRGHLPAIAEEKHLVDFLVGLKQVQMAALQSAALPNSSPQPTSN
jgi:hypothetical protein